MKKYNIALDCRFFGLSSGGIGRYAQELASNLAKLDRHNNYSVVLRPGDVELANLSGNFTPISIDAPHFSITEQILLNKELKSRNFDLVHFTNFNHPILYRRPFVVTVHDLIMHRYPSGRSQKSLVRRTAYKKVMSDCRRAKTVIVPSEATKKDLVGQLKFKEGSIVVTPEGSSRHFRLHRADEVKSIRAKYSLPSRYLLFVSRWEPYKGLLELIEAYRSLVKDDPELGLVIIGKSDPQSPHISNAVEMARTEMPNIVLPGFVSDADLAAIYSAATVYVHPSWYEGFGIMILEAFASGVPVVTTTAASLPEVAGDAAITVHPKNSAMLRDAIQKLLKDSSRRQELINAGLERVKKFSWQKMAEQTLGVYEEVLSK